jgi:hypothetical protein
MTLGNMRENGDLNRDTPAERHVIAIASKRLGHPLHRVRGRIPAHAGAAGAGLISIDDAQLAVLAPALAIAAASSQPV